MHSQISVLSLVMHDGNCSMLSMAQSVLYVFACCKTILQDVLACEEQDVDCCASLA